MGWGTLAREAAKRNSQFPFAPRPGSKAVRQAERAVKELLENLTKPKPKVAPPPVAAPLPEGKQPKKSRPKRKNNSCCEAVPFTDKWPVKKKKPSLVPGIGWFDWGKEIDGEKIGGQRVIWNRGYIFQLEVTENICGGFEYKCKDNLGKVGSAFQWADGLNPGVCNMIEVKYAMHETTWTAEKAADITIPAVRDRREQFRKYAMVCNDPRRIPELKCLDQVGLEVYVNWKTMAEFYEELMYIYGIPGPSPEVRLPRNEMKTGVRYSNGPNGIDTQTDETGSVM
ncbi:hypothetical protein [Pseudovibrio brasiliensis]|uniref:Tox-REase-5 domain-containing protein n=1 Tax=Pseudovibrio brasiliensis TaxID=1898042 RepID=A0ABX8AVR2_9HYPH|nr:hypothetical protein [Pseudovibrio brasiliensis]QUS59149.1 hypothetical protein KGB56_26510 [Pseudovibrio brasiliensis]